MSSGSSSPPIRETYQLFKYDTCGFCMRVRGFIAQAGLDVPLRDVILEPEARQELLAGGGKSTVPCLRIERADGVQWLYESIDIIHYLESVRTG